MWDKKPDSELAYDIFSQEQRARQRESTKRNVHDPLPAPPSQFMNNKTPVEVNRRRTASERLPTPPPLRHRLSANDLDDTSPYAEFSAETKALIKAKSGHALTIPMTSTPNAIDNHMPVEKGTTPITAGERRSHGDDIYAEVSCQNV